MVTHSTEKPFKCTHEGCTNSYSTAYSLKIHVMNHTGERPFECAKCPMKFKTQQNRELHQRKHLRAEAKLNGTQLPPHLSTSSLTNSREDVASVGSGMDLSQSDDVEESVDGSDGLLTEEYLMNVINTHGATRNLRASEEPWEEFRRDVEGSGDGLQTVQSSDSVLLATPPILLSSPFVSTLASGGSTPPSYFKSGGILKEEQDGPRTVAVSTNWRNVMMD
ncbi:hypothetical protein HDU99_004332 [Rhizoclosmatium hyalinum]|nr:hypothetical protein HDU99_004332 [Rhizoclosmatium hyalinum]